MWNDKNQTRNKLWIKYKTKTKTNQFMWNDENKNKQINSSESCQVQQNQSLIKQSQLQMNARRSMKSQIK